MFKNIHPVDLITLACSLLAIQLKLQYPVLSFSTLQILNCLRRVKLCFAILLEEKYSCFQGSV